MNKRIGLLCLFACISLSSYAADEAQATAPAEEPKKADKEKIGYTLGAAAAQQMIRNYAVGEDFDPADALKGFNDVLAGKSQMSEDEIDQEFVKQYKDLDTPAHWKKLNETFLATNAKKKDVVTTKSGLQYKVITDGKGELPKATDAVNANYRGTYVNGYEFDSSARHGKMPANFPVDKVIPGWTEALQLMKVGSKWKLFVPANLAYGVAPKNGMRADSALIFEVELVDIGGPKTQSSHGNGNANVQQKEVSK